MAKYVIDGATLTAIADTLRGLVGGDEITPEDMPDKIALAYDVGYDVGYETAQDDFPRAEGTTSFLSQDYRIYGDVLTDIQVAIRDKGHLYVSEATSPEDMPEAIGYVYDTGYDVGYTEAYDGAYTDALLALPTPLVLQARATPTYSSDFDDYIYVGSTYNNAVGDTTYTMYSFIEYECMDSQSNLVLAVHNKTNRPVTFYFEAAVTDNGQPSSLVYLYKSITVDPNTSSSFEFSYGYQEPEWDYYLIGLRFI